MTLEFVAGAASSAVPGHDTARQDTAGVECRRSAAGRLAPIAPGRRRSRCAPPRASGREWPEGPSHMVLNRARSVMSRVARPADRTTGLAGGSVGPRAHCSDAATCAWCSRQRSSGSLPASTPASSPRGPSRRTGRGGSRGARLSPRPGPRYVPHRAQRSRHLRGHRRTSSPCPQAAPAPASPGPALGPHGTIRRLGGEALRFGGPRFLDRQDRRLDEPERDRRRDATRSS
jgi:hypothetical protein